MSLRWSGKTQAGVLTAACLLVSACIEQAPSDTEVIEDFRLNRANFEKIIHIVCEETITTSFEIRGRRPLISTPKSHPLLKTRTIQKFLINNKIENAYFECSPHIFASFDVSSSGLGVSGQLKRLIYSPTGISENSGGELVDDTDAALSRNDAQWTLVHRDIGNGWFITNSG